MIKALFISSLLLASTAFGQCEQGTGLAKTWQEKTSYCTYRYVEVTNTTGKTMAIVIYILEDDGIGS